MLRRPLTALTLACALAVTLAAPPVSAQPDAKSEAIKHFDEGVKLRDRYDYSGAIREFLEVLKHDESVGAWLNLGACYDATKDYRRAVDAYEQAAVVARRKSDERSVDAKEAAKRIRSAHPWIILVVGRDVATLDGLEIRVDDIPVPKDDFGGEVFRPQKGRHTVVVSTRDREAAYSVNDKETVEVKLDALHPKADKVAPPPPPPPPGGDDSGGGWGWQKWTGLGLMIASVVPLALSVKWGIDNQNDQDDIASQYAQKHTDKSGNPNPCSGNTTPGLVDSKGRPIPIQSDECGALEKQFNQNQSQARARLIPGIAIGGVMLLGGAALFIFASSGKSSEPSSGRIDVRFSPTLGGGVVFGRF